MKEEKKKQQKKNPNIRENKQKKLPQTKAKGDFCQYCPKEEDASAR